MNELLNISESTINNDVIPTVSARDLWEKLEIGRDFSNWIKDQIEMFDENKDYVVVAKKGESNNNKYDTPNRANQKRGGDRRSIEYHLTLNCAEHIALMSRTPKGKEIRQYFIDVESVWRHGKGESKQLRDKSKKVRNVFTDCLKEHGYTKQGHYIQTTTQMKKALGITNKKDDMTERELRKIMASETLAELRIEEMNVNGYENVNPVCVETSKIVDSTIKNILKIS